MKSINHRRLKQNPTEARFVELWDDFNKDDKILKYILDREQTNRGQYTPTGTEREVAVTLIQWLGSHVGQSFLKQLTGATHG